MQYPLKCYYICTITRIIICDMIKQNDLELANTDFGPLDQFQRGLLLDHITLLCTSQCTKLGIK